MRLTATVLAALITSHVTARTDPCTQGDCAPLFTDPQPCWELVSSTCLANFGTLGITYGPDTEGPTVSVAVCDACDSGASQSVEWTSEHSTSFQVCFESAYGIQAAGGASCLLQVQVGSGGQVGWQACYTISSGGTITGTCNCEADSRTECSLATIVRAATVSLPVTYNRLFCYRWTGNSRGPYACLGTPTTTAFSTLLYCSTEVKETETSVPRFELVATDVPCP